MAKFQSMFFTSALTKELKRSESVYVSLDAEKKRVTVSNGFFLAVLSLPEYDALIRPVTGRDPGSFTIDKSGFRDGAPDFSKAMNRTGNEAAAQLAPFTFPDEDGKKAMNAYYSAERGTTFVNAAFVSMLARPQLAYSAGPVSPLLYLTGDGDLIALLLPIRVQKPGKLSAAVSAYFDETDTGAKIERLEAEKREALSQLTIATQNRDYYKEQLEKIMEERDTYAAQLADIAKAAAEDRAEEAKPAEEKPALNTAGLEKLDGVTVIIKGAATNKPVAWISGDTKKHADALKAAGCKWSVKKSAWYLTA